MKENSILKKTYKKFLMPTSASVMSMAIMSFVNIIVASILFGRTGTDISSMVLPIIIFSNVIIYFFGVGGSIALSVAQGSGEKQRANKIFNLSIILGLVISILATALGLLFLDKLVGLLASDLSQAVTDNMSKYTKVLIWGLPANVIFVVMSNFIRNDNSPNFSMLGVIASVVINVLVLLISFTFLNGGIWCISLATALGNLVACFIYAYYIFAKKGSLNFDIKMDFKELKSIFSPGFAGSMIFLAQSILTVVIINILYDTFGNEGVAIYGVYKYITSAIFAFYDCVNHSSQPMFGVYYGDRDYTNIRGTAKISVKLLFITAISICIILLAFAGVISKLFEVNGDIAFRVLAVTCLFSSIISFFVSYYRVAGKAFLSLCIVVANNLILPSLLILLFVYPLNLTTNGVWLALLVTDIISLMAIILFTKRKPLLIKNEIESSKIYTRLILNEEANIVALNEEIEAFCEKNGIKMKIQYHILLCFEEIAVNIIKHGFKDGKEHYIQIRIVAEDDGALLNIRDDASQYDPTQKTDADVTASAEDRDIGGLGIYLVKKVSKEFSYNRIIGFNNLHIKF